MPADLPGMEAPSLVDLMRTTRDEWDVWTRGSAIRRAGCAGFKRNVTFAVTVAERDQEPLVREHAAWALERAVGR